MKRMYKLFAAALLTASVLSGGCRCCDKKLQSKADVYENMFQNTVQKAGKKVFPALVYIKVVQANLDGGSSSSASASGSGVLITPDGEIVTNYHVIDKAVSIRCLLNDGRNFDAEIVGSDKDTDLALLKLKLPKDTPALPYADFSRKTISEGEFVMALGAPWGLNRSISIGIISCVNRYLPGHSEYSLWYQTDASISPGNSGGPMIDTDGRIVGINTLGMFGGGTLAFTIPSSTVEVILPRLRKYGKVNWAWFGLRFQPLKDFERNIYLPYKEGVLIAGTEVGSPAQAAGFEPNDLLLAINGVKVNAETSEALPAIYRQLGLSEFGQQLKFTIQREGHVFDITCAAGEKGKVEGDEVVCENWGFTAKTINRFDNPNLHFYRSKGVFVHGIKPRSPAARAYLMKNDIIIQINGVDVSDLAGLFRCYQQAEKRSVNDRRSVITVMRNGETIQLPIYINL